MTRARHVATAVALALVLLAACGAAGAHELGAVQVRAHFDAAGSYRVTLTVDRTHLPPALAHASDEELAGRLAQGASVRFDDRIDAPRVATPASAPLTIVFEGTIPRGAASFAWTLTVPVGAYYLSCTNAAGEDEAQWVETGAPSRPFALTSSAMAPSSEPANSSATAPRSTGRLTTLARYIVLGITHIVPLGTDHILFVLGLFLLTLRVRPLLVQVTAFTLAHSITLALAVTGVATLPSRVVEPLIAVSIVFVAVENVLTRKLTWRRTALVFAFGLLHGMGFAGALRDVGLPKGQLATGLVGFNVGVELGQLIVLGAASALLGWSASRPWHRARIVVPASLAIAAMGLFWAVERIA